MLRVEIDDLLIGVPLRSQIKSHKREGNLPSPMGNTGAATKLRAQFYLNYFLNEYQNAKYQLAQTDRFR